MRYKNPTDIPRLQIQWENVPLEDRLNKWAEYSRKYPGVEHIDWIVAVAISEVEQPGKIPSGNAVGLMPFAPAFPYGWKADVWVVRPHGWTLLREGQTGQTVPFLAFPHWADSIRVCAEIVKRRSIRTGEGYARRWVGLKLPGQVARTAREFDEVLQKIKEAQNA
ncbi:hypothetical protein [Thermogutta sp.]|uniref:hypothetical protein n=1 Tax=Thermogutta sp. TaxID=1962930 RepID=UPI00322028B9